MEKNTVTAPPSLVWATRTLSLIGAAALGLTGELRLYTLGVYGLLFVLGLRIERRTEMVRLAGRAQPFFAAMVFALAIGDFIYLSESFLLAGAHFLLLIQALRLLALVTVRDNIGSVMLSSLMILSASTLSVDWTFFLALVLFLPTVVWTVIWANLFAEYQTLGAVDDLNMRASSWLRAIPAAKKATALAFVVAALTCALVFITFPRLNLQGFRGQFLQPVRKTGFANNVELRSGGRISEDDTIVMRVEMEAKDRTLWNGYLRGAALDVFNGAQWRKSTLKTERIYRSFRLGVVIPFQRAGRGKVVRQSIYLESLDTALLFAAPWPTWIGLDQPFIERGEDLSLSRRSGNTWRLHYTVDSFLPSNGVMYEKRRFPELSKSHLDVKGVAGGRLNELLVPLIGPEKNPLNIAQKIETFLRTQYGYTLDLGEAKTGNPLDVFLFDKKKGHCEYFATAMCLLLRQKGIPSRMVTGFVAHEWNKRGGYYIVRMKDAHTWVEAYIQPSGWVQFDPTPRDFETGPSQSAWLGRLADMADYLNLQWNRQILSYDFERQVGLARALTIKSQIVSFRFENMIRSFRHLFDWKSGAPGVEEKSTTSAAKSIVLFLGLLIGPGVLFFLWRRRAKKKEAVWFYRPFLKALEKIGGRKSPGKTMAEFSSELKPKLGNAVPAAFFLTEEYHRQRFGKSPSDAGLDQRIKSALMELKHCSR